MELDLFLKICKCKFQKCITAFCIPISSLIRAAKCNAFDIDSNINRLRIFISSVAYLEISPKALGSGTRPILSSIVTPVSDWFESLKLAKASSHSLLYSSSIFPSITKIDSQSTKLPAK